MIRHILSVTAWTVATFSAVVAGLFGYVWLVPDAGGLIYIYMLGLAGWLEQVGLPTLENYPDQSWPVMTTLGSMIIFLTLGLLSLLLALVIRFSFQIIKSKKAER